MISLHRCVNEHSSQIHAGKKAWSTYLALAMSVVSLSFSPVACGAISWALATTGPAVLAQNRSALLKGPEPVK